MTELTMMGLGRMGAAIAHNLQADGHGMTVWNRSPEKLQGFVAAGARAASSVTAGIRASPVVLICVDDYAVARELLNTDFTRAALEGKTVVQLSTGTPGEAEADERWFDELGARYIDGAILGGPETLAGENARVIFSGSRKAYDDAREVLESTCHTVLHVGENIRAAAVLDMAWLCRHYGMFAGVTHGALICEAEDIDLDHYVNVIPSSEYAHKYVETIRDEAFEDTPATLKTWAGALDAIRRHAVETGVNREVPELFCAQFEKALAAGYGNEDVAALVKALRPQRQGQANGD